jgi:hypothetical protein
MLEYDDFNSDQPASKGDDKLKFVGQLDALHQR